MRSFIKRLQSFISMFHVGVFIYQQTKYNYKKESQKSNSNLQVSCSPYNIYYLCRLAGV